MKNYMVTHTTDGAPSSWCADKAVDKHYGSKYDKAKTDKCHTFVEALVPNGAERVKKVVQTLY